MAEAPANPGLPVPLHLNRGGYRGEQVAVLSILSQVAEEAAKAGWEVGELIRMSGHPVWILHRHGRNQAAAYHRIYLSAGIHGDEPAGPLALLHLIRQNEWPQDAEIAMLPCLNPEGLAQNRREGPEGVDFNRDFRNPKTSLVKAHIEWLRGQPRFDAALLLHEDWEADGFYLYELTRGSRSVANSAIRSVSSVCPILLASHADDWPAENGVVRPAIDPASRPEWPEAIFLFLEKTDLSCTFEAPSDYDLSTRVKALATAVKSALQTITGEAR